MDYPVVTAAQLSAHLRSLRKAQKLTQRQLGLRIGLSQSRLGKIERNPTHVGVGELFKVLAELNVLIVLRASPVETSPNTPDDPNDW